MRPAAANRAFLWTLLALAGVLLVQACTNRDVIAVQVGVITITPNTFSMLEGESQQFRAVVDDVGGRALPRATVLWTSESPDILSIDQDGMSEALVAGDADVTATFGGVSGR